jgi:hypothetical protein
MWNPPIALTPEEQKIVARTRKTRKFCVFLRERRHEILAADLPHALAQSYSPEPGGKAPVEVGLWALATRLPAYCHVGDRDAVELTVMDKRWQLGLDGLGVEPPPFSQSTLFNFRRRLSAHNLDTTLLARTVAVAEPTGGLGTRPLRAVLDSPPLVGAGRVEATLNRLGHARRKAVGLTAQELGTSAAAVVADAGLTLRGHSSLKAALDLDGGEPRARARALGLVLDEVARWQRWLEQQHPLAVQAPPLKEAMDPIAHIITQDTEPAPDGGPGSRRITPHLAPDRRLSIEEPDRRHGRKSSAKTFTGVKEPFAVDWDSTVIREVVVRPANEPEQEAVDLRAEEWETPPGRLQRAIDLGYRASPRLAPWEAQGVDMIARPWPQVGPLFTKPDFTLDLAHRHVTCPGGQRVPRVPGQSAQFPAAGWDVCALRAQGTKAMHGHGRSLHLREDEQFQQQLRATSRTQRGRASLRKRTAVEHAISHQLAHQGRRARYQGLRKNQCDGRRHAAVSNLQVAAHDEEQHRLAS